MKRMLIGLFILGLAGSALAVDKAQLNDRIQSLNKEFVSMQQNSAHRVPANELAQAKGIILLDQSKGGFLFAYHGGDGIAMVRDASGNWSAPAFVSSSGASLGFQAGGERDFFVILLKSPQAADALTQQKLNFGAQAGGTGGGESYNASATTIPANSVVVYSERHGVFGGASVMGGAISPDNHANAVYYGRPVSMNSILFSGQVQPTPMADHLIGDLSYFQK